MLFATVDGEKVEANPNTRGICPVCESTVFSKCGEINVWHWSHRKEESCDSWYEPETEWHKNWKLAFGKINCEIVITKDEKRHIADIFTNSNVVIELQNSPIQKPVIRNRENFYGEKMLWVINGKHFKDNFEIKPFNFDYEDEHNLPYNHFITATGTVDKETGELISPPTNEVSFAWNWCRKSWNEAERHIFIDFGDEHLFMITKGMGSARGKGKQITKEKFLRKYGGDLALLETLIEKTL